MDTPMHILIAESAVDCLTDDCANFWNPFRAAMAKASNYPDYFAAGERKADVNAQIDCEWREYTMIPDNDHKGAIAHSMITPLELRKNYPSLLKHWNEAIINNIKSGNLEKAAKFAGCLSHLVGDTGQAAHVFHECYLKYLLPQGDKRFIIHSTIEKVPGHIGHLTHQPKVLALSLDELNWRLVEELEVLKYRNMAEVVPIMQAILKNDNTAAEASASRTLFSCVELFADVLFTIWNLVSNKTAQHENMLKLSSLMPIKEHCDMLFNYGIMLHRIPGKRIDESIPLDLGNGNTPGVALLADMAPHHKTVREAFVDYSIPPGIFKYLNTEIGLNRNCINETKAIFKIKLDGKTVFTSEVLSEKDAPVKLNIKLEKAERLQLYVCDARTAPCSTKFFYPVFADPVVTERT